MFRKFILTAALFTLAFAAAAQEVPASAASAPEVATTTPSTEAAPANSAVKSGAGWVGSLFGSAARSVVNVSKGFVDGVKKGYSKDDSNVAVEQTATVAPTPAAVNDKTQVSGSRLRELQSLFTRMVVARQAPAPVETRTLTPVVATSDSEEQAH